MNYLQKSLDEKEWLQIGNLDLVGTPIRGLNFSMVALLCQVPILINASRLLGRRQKSYPNIKNEPMLDATLAISSSRVNKKWFL